MVYIHVCVSVCIVIIFTIFWWGWLLVFVSIKSNSFDVKSDDFCLLKIWICELLLINIKQRSVQQSTIEFLRILSIFRGNFYFLSLATVAVDVSVIQLPLQVFKRKQYSLWKTVRFSRRIFHQWCHRLITW